MGSLFNTAKKVGTTAAVASGNPGAMAAMGGVNALTSGQNLYGTLLGTALGGIGGVGAEKNKVNPTQVLNDLGLGSVKDSTMTIGRNLQDIIGGGNRQDQTMYAMQPQTNTQGRLLEALLKNNTVV